MRVRFLRVTAVFRTSMERMETSSAEAPSIVMLAATLSMRTCSAYSPGARVITAAAPASSLAASVIASWMVAKLFSPLRTTGSAAS